MKLRFIIYLCVMTIFCACTDHRQYPAVTVDRVDLAMRDFAKIDSAGQQQIIDSLRVPLEAMFKVLGTDTLDLAIVDAWSRNRVVEVFQPAVDSVFPADYDFGRIVGDIVGNAKAESLGLPDLRFATVTWGNPRQMVRVDSVVLIALNHYLGPDYPGYSRWQKFQRVDKRPEMLPYDLAAVLAATQYPMHTSQAPTLLNWMLYEGALVEVRMRLVPDADMATALGYGKEEYEYVSKNLKKIWGDMAAQRVLYDTNPLTIDRYISSAPSSPVLSGQAPGRIGRYVGYEIIKAYVAKHVDTSLKYLMSQKFYDNPKALIDSQFNP